MSRLWLGLLVCGTLWAGTALDTAAAESTTASEPKLTAKGVEYFESKIRPVLTQR